MQHRYSVEDLEKVRNFIQKYYQEGAIPKENLGLLAKQISKLGVRENGMPIEPSVGAVLRLLDKLDFVERG